VVVKNRQLTESLAGEVCQVIFGAWAVKTTRHMVTENIMG